jgi:hypothetical protein
MGDFQDSYKITSADRAGKGVTGLPDTPGLSTGDMQARFDSLGNLSIDKFNAVVDSVGDTITNDGLKLPTMKAIVAYVSAMGGGDMTKAVYDTDDDGVVDNSKLFDGKSVTDFINEYVITCPTSGYTSESVTIWGDTKTLAKIVISADKDGNPLTNFHSGMKEDYALNISGSASDFSKLYAHEIGEGEVTFYFTSAPTTAFNVLIREAV